MHAGTPASVWQLEETRSLFPDGDGISVAGHQCQFDGVDRKKPTRLFGNLPGLEAFGYSGWPRFDSQGYYRGPLPKNCGHDHSQQMICRTAEGGFATSPTAAYSEAMCMFIARLVVLDFVDRARMEGSSSASALAGPANSDTEACEQKGVDRPLAEGPDLVLDTDGCTESAMPHGATPAGSLATTTCRPGRFDWAQADTSDEENKLGGIRRPKRGEGWWGRGPPIAIHHKGEPRPITDGAGLPSPGRWPIQRRILPDDSVVNKLREIVRDCLVACAQSWPKQCMKRKLLEIACGRCRESPFDGRKIQEARTKLRQTLREAGHGSCEARPGDRPQKFDTRLMRGLLAACQDPDHHFCEWWSRGVWLGSDARRLPRTPAIFERKRTRRLSFPEEGEWAEWRPNYASAEENRLKVEAQFAEEEAEGLMVRMPSRQALRKHGADLSLAAIGAIEKKGSTSEVRVIHDASHGVLLNHCIRVRDQVRLPTAADNRAALKAMYEESGPHFALGYDIRKAHRRVPVTPEDWGRQACQTQGTAVVRVQEIRKVE